MSLSRSFDNDVTLYERGRLGYLDEAVRYALPTAGGRVLDLGAGTGKLTACVVDRAAEVIAIDPSESMLTALRTKLPHVETRVASAEDTGLPAASVDAIVVGSAVHWFDRPAADAEMARVLRPGGPVAVLWNLLDPDDPTFDVFTRLRGTPEYVPDLDLDRRWFGPTVRRDFVHIEQSTVEAMTDMLGSRSYLLSKPEPERVEALGWARDRFTDLAGGGTALAVRHRTTVFRAIRTN